MKLKEKIVNLKHCKIEWFDSCQELSNKIQNDLFDIISIDFPLNLNQINENDKEIYKHQLFRNLLTNKVYIDINNISSKLNNFLYHNINKNILIIYGDLVWKITILANFDKNNEEHDDLIISRYIGDQLFQIQLYLY